MPNFEQGEPVDDFLQGAHHRFIEDLRQNLDIEAGLAEIIPDAEDIAPTEDRAATEAWADAIREIEQKVDEWVADGGLNVAKERILPESKEMNRNAGMDQPPDQQNQ